MPLYEYKAVSFSGANKRGNINADNETQAKMRLKQMELIPTSIIASSEKKNKGEGGTLFSGFMKKTIPLNDLMLFIRQLSTLFSSGMQLDSSIKLISEKADKLTIRKMTADLRESLQEGTNFANALQKSPYKFDKNFIATIHAGQESGHLSQVLDRLVDEIEYKMNTKQTLTSALVYPIVLILVSIIVVVGLLVYVVPQITEVFSTSNRQLPNLTVQIIAISDFFINHGQKLFWGVTIFVLFFLLRMRSDSFKLKVHKKILQIPLIGELVLESILSKWSRSLSLLLSSGVNTLEAMYIANQGLENLHIKEILAGIMEKVREGKGIAIAMEMEKSMLPSFLIHMINAGEQSSTLDKMLIKCSEYYSQSVKTLTNSFVKIFEPILILFMGGVVVVIVMAVLLPILELNKLVV